MKEGNSIPLIDDSPTQALYMKNLLERNGYIVSSARNGREVLASLREHQPRIVVSDVMMPVMDGYELCREIKRDDNLKGISVILPHLAFEYQRHTAGPRIRRRRLYHQVLRLAIYSQLH